MLFWFGNQQKKQAWTTPKMAKNKESQQIGMPTMNNKMMTNNNVGYRKGLNLNENFIIDYMWKNELNL
jgi:hypothetical protein